MKLVCNLYRRCRKIDNSSTLSIFLQLGYTQYKIHEFLCRTLQRIDVVNFSTTSIRCRCMELVRNLYATCRQTCQVLYQSTYAEFFWHLSKKIHSRQISTETQNSYCTGSATHNTKHHPTPQHVYATASSSWRRVARDERQRRRATVAVTRPAAAAREAKEGLPPAAREETAALRRS